MFELYLTLKMGTAVDTGIGMSGCRAVLPENLSRTNEQHGRPHRITLQVARTGDAGRRVPEMRLPYPGSVGAPSADSVRPLLKIGACASRGNSQDIGQ